MSFEIMRRERIQDALTINHHFSIAGQHVRFADGTEGDVDVSDLILSKQPGVMVCRHPVRPAPGSCDSADLGAGLGAAVAPMMLHA